MRAGCGGCENRASLTDPGAFVTAAYRAVLGRAPDAEGHGHYVQALSEGRLDPAGVLALMAASPEAQRRLAAAPPGAAHPGPALPAGSDVIEAGRRRLLPATDAALAMLSAEQALRPDQSDYAAMHRWRFAETAHVIATMLQDHPDWPACRVLEIGSSITPLLYHRLFPGLLLQSLDIVDHPNLAGIVQAHHRLDLEQIDLRGEAVLPVTGLHMLLFCEVLEHMLVNPANMFRLLARSLALGGVLFVTTPNFYRRHVRQRIAAGQNPQPLYPADYGPEHRFFHHQREYTMQELLDAARGAGLLVGAAWYSDCWDTDTPDLPSEERQNLALVCRRT